MAGVCIERFGRRLTLMVITSSLYFLSFLTIFLADSAAVVLVGRLVHSVQYSVQYCVQFSTVYSTVQPAVSYIYLLEMV